MPLWRRQDCGARRDVRLFEGRSASAPPPAHPPERTHSYRGIASSPPPSTSRRTADPFRARPRRHVDTGLSRIEGCCRRRRQHSKEECSPATCLCDRGFQRKWKNHPSPVHVRTSVDERFIPENVEYSAEVVLNVVPVIRQIGIPATSTGCDQDVHPRSMWCEPKFRLNGPNGHIGTAERPFEFADELLTESLHDVQDLFAVPEVVVGAVRRDCDHRQQHEP